MQQSATNRWALEEFGHAELGDSRRTARLVAMAAEAATRPAGKVSEVFASAAARQGAYDFLESRVSHAPGLLRAMQRACSRRANAYRHVLIPIDGSSLSLVDRQQSKDFGSIGARAEGGRGLKVINALAVSPDGTPLGIAAMRWWARSTEALKPSHSRSPKNRESHLWLEVIDDALAALKRDAPDTVAWFQIDREGDAQFTLKKLANSGHLFTIRSNGTRRLLQDLRDGRRDYLRPRIQRLRRRGYFQVDVSARPHRRARRACLAVRFGEMTLKLRNVWSKTSQPLTVNVVHVREVRTNPRGEAPLDWMLLTNHPVNTLKQAKEVVRAYTCRWRIEDFHRAWKRGSCNVEQTQLRKSEHVITWATLLAAVAARVERLKHLSRTQPDQPASVELTEPEIRALILLKRKYKRRTEVIPDEIPSIAKATLWIAELGGFTGKSSGGPPGATTLSRGLERLRFAADAIQELTLLPGSRKKKR